MTLKTRFTLIAIIPAVLIGVVVLIANSMTDRQAEERVTDLVLRGKSVLWQKILGNELSRLAVAMPSLTRDRLSLESLRKGDARTLGEGVVTTYNRLSTGKVLTNILVVDGNGQVLYYAEDGYDGAGRKVLVKAALVDGTIKRGIEWGDDGRLAAMLVFPLYLRGKLIGAGVYLQDLQGLVDDFHANDGSEVYIVGGDGTVAYATDDDLYGSLELQGAAAVARGTLVKENEGKVYTVTVQPLRNATGDPIARLLSVSDMTAGYKAKQGVQLISYVLIFLSIVIGYLVFFWFTHRSFRPLEALMDVVRRLSEGDTSVRTDVTGSDEIGQLGGGFNKMAQSIQDAMEREHQKQEEIEGKAELILDVLHRIAEGDLTAEMMVFSGDTAIDAVAVNTEKMLQRLNELVSKVQESGIQVTSSTNEIAATAREQEATVTEQAATTNQITATVQEISATAKELANTVDEVSKVVEETAGSATEGQTALASMEDTMGQMRDATASITSKLAVLSEKAANINNVVTTITKVADQTNLLSLNAAIEAEKAGEYGAGFSVVATEIRRLADQTAVATWDIEQMVKEMQSAVSAGVMGMDKFTEDVRRGVEEVRQVGGQLADIIEQVRDLLPRFEQVQEGMRSQALGATQISDSIVQLSEGSQQTADSLRQSNSTIQQLKEAAELLQQGVSQFKVSA